MAPQGGGTKLGGALLKLRIFCPKTPFFALKQPWKPFKTPKQREVVATLHVRLDFPVTKSPLLPSNSTICPRNGPKMARNVRNICQTTSKPRTGRILGCVAKIREHLVHPQSPTFCRFQASELPNEMSRPPYQLVTWRSRRAARAAHGGGQRWVHQVPRGEKMIFSQVVTRPLRMLKQVFSARFERVMTHFGPRKIPQCPENGPFWGQRWVKNG